MNKEIPNKAVGVSKYEKEFDDFLKWRGAFPTITLVEAFDEGYDVGHEKKEESGEKKCYR